MADTPVEVAISNVHKRVLKIRDIDCEIRDNQYRLVKAGQEVDQWQCQQRHHAAEIHRLRLVANEERAKLREEVDEYFAECGEADGD